MRQRALAAGAHAAVVAEHFEKGGAGTPSIGRKAAKLACVVWRSQRIAQRTVSAHLSREWAAAALPSGAAVDCVATRCRAAAQSRPAGLPTSVAGLPEVAIPSGILSSGLTGAVALAEAVIGASADAPAGTFQVGRWKARPSRPPACISVSTTASYNGTGRL